MNISAANYTDEQHWYLKYNQKGESPVTPDLGKYSKDYDAIYLDESGEKTIYLTFDAGYENGNVEKTLDILKKHDVKAAFFLLPNVIKANGNLVSRMYSEGHLICNHTRSHRNMARVHDFSTFQRELLENECILKDTLGIEMSKFYRPPEGAFCEENLEFAKRCGYRTVFWSLAYADWDNKNQPNPEKSLSLLLSRVHPGCVMLLHPNSETNAAILDCFITEMKNNGYTFKSLEEFPSNCSYEESVE